MSGAPVRLYSVVAVRGVIRPGGMLLVVAVLAGCANGTGPRTSPELATTTSTPEGVFYVGVEALAVQDAPKRSGNVVGHFPLHRKVMRSRVAKGYALVRDADGALAGWVLNSKLLWRLPRSEPADAKAAAAPQAPKPRSHTGASVLHPY